MTSRVIYEGTLRTVATHIKSDKKIETDAPIDNHGKGERFSPTDLLATSLASCMCTIMGIAANTHNIDINGTACDVEKIMADNPRRVAEIKVNMQFPDGKNYSDKEKKILEQAAVTCPVYLSLHSDLKKTVLFIWS